MQTNVDHGRLALARAKFEPVARVLDEIAKNIEKEYGRSAVLKQRSRMAVTARNVYAVRYSLRHPDEVRFALTFIVTGENADLLLMQTKERSGPEDVRAHPGQTDPRVYRLAKIDEVKKAVQGKISAHLCARQIRSTHQAA
jgi:hypothetical protein